MSQGPSRIIINIRCKSEFRTCFQYVLKDAKILIRDNATLSLSDLWPRIGIENIKPVNAAAGQVLAKLKRITGINADIVTLQNINLIE